MNRLYILLYILIILSCNEDKNDNIFIDENEDVDINFENLLHAYTQPNPRDYFYMKVFKKPYAEVIKDSKPQSMRDY